MNHTLLRIMQSREDISDYLFHFTKGSNASEALSSIIKCQKIIDVKKQGYICFTEAPVTLLTDMFKIFNDYEEPLYAPYGIAVKKDWLFERGARPVIYGLPKERGDFPQHVQWRFVDYIPNVHDFSWLREWRIKSKYVELSYENCFIITPTSSECEALAFNDDVDFDFDGCIEDGVFHGSVEGNFSRSYKDISLEEIAKLKTLSKNELDALINEQTQNDNIGRNLGCF